jgi:hypothetical protein
VIRLLQRAATVTVITTFWTVRQPAADTQTARLRPPTVGYHPDGKTIDARQWHELWYANVVQTDAAGQYETCAAWVRLYNRIAHTKYARWRPAGLPAVIDDTNPATDCRPDPARQL